METKKLAAIFAILMMALGVAGFAYAHWEKVIVIDGTVSTGTLHLTPTFHASTDDVKGYCTVDWEIYEEENTMDVWIENAYPCINVTATFGLLNDGSVPAGLYKWTATYDDTTVTIFDADNIGGSIINPGMTEDEVETALENWIESLVGNYADVEIDFAGSNFWQIDPQENPTVTITIHFLEGLPQDCSVSFSTTLEYWNWNEVGYLS